MKNTTFLLFTCAMIFAACTTKNTQKVSTSDEPSPVEVKASLFYNHDSLAYYAERAYLNDEPHALFVTGMAAYLHRDDPNFPDSLYTVTTDEADIMLLHAAELGDPDALQFIRCKAYHGQWNHSIPEESRP